MQYPLQAAELLFAGPRLAFHFKINLFKPSPLTIGTLMQTSLDHLVVVAPTLEAGDRFVSQRLGVKLRTARMRIEPYRRQARQD